MPPKTAIITLIILAILGLLFLGYLYYYTQKHSFIPINNIINNKNKKETKELTPEEIRQRMIEKAETPESIKRKEEVENMSPEELKELKEKMINKAKSK